MVRSLFITISEGHEIIGACVSPTVTETIDLLPETEHFIYATINDDSFYTKSVEFIFLL